MMDEHGTAPLSTADMVAATRPQSNGEAVQATSSAGSMPASASPTRMATREGNGSAGSEPMQTDGGSDNASRTQDLPRMTAANGSAGAAGQTAPLMPADRASGYHDRWEEIQTGFVDEPRHAVEQADQLVAEVIKQIAEVFADERGKLETQWSRGDQVDTEALRVALRRYRSFFERLLAA